MTLRGYREASHLSTPNLTLQHPFEVSPQSVSVAFPTNLLDRPPHDIAIRQLSRAFAADNAQTLSHHVHLQPVRPIRQLSSWPSTLHRWQASLSHSRYATV